MRHPRAKRIGGNANRPNLLRLVVAGTVLVTVANPDDRLCTARGDGWDEIADRQVFHRHLPAAGQDTRAPPITRRVQRNVGVAAGASDLEVTGDETALNVERFEMPGAVAQRQQVGCEGLIDRNETGQFDRVAAVETGDAQGAQTVGRVVAGNLPICSGVEHQRVEVGNAGAKTGDRTSTAARGQFED